MTYSYDGRNRRVTSTNGSGQVERYVYDGSRLVQVFDPSESFASVSYVYSDSLDDPVALLKGQNRFFFMKDQRGSVIGLSNDQGDMVEHYSYDAFGKVTITNSQGEQLSRSSYGNRYLFMGRWFDHETGLYNYRNRIYSPSLGRFLTPDPMGYVDGINLYAYVKNNPIFYYDPMGTKARVTSEDSVFNSDYSSSYSSSDTYDDYDYSNYSILDRFFSSPSSSESNSDNNSSSSSFFEDHSQQSSSYFTVPDRPAFANPPSNPTRTQDTNTYTPSTSESLIPGAYAYNQAVHYAKRQDPIRAVTYATIGLAEQVLSVLTLGTSAPILSSTRATVQTTSTQVARTSSQGSFWTATKKKTSVENAYMHYRKHKNEFSQIQNAKQYVDTAKEFLNKPPRNSLFKKRDNGDILQYNPNTNIFGVKTSDGTPKTMFKPKDKIKYWEKQ